VNRPPLGTQQYLTAVLPLLRAETGCQRKPTKLLSLAYERALRRETNQAHSVAASPEPSEAKPQLHQTHVRLTTRRFDDIAPDVRDRAIDFRAVIATTAIVVMIELP
jgi:hypothetical protein